MKYWHFLLFICSYIGINCITKCTYQRHRCCAFDSPGLPNDSAGYAGLVYVVWGTTPSVLRILCVIRHESPCYNHVFKEKAQHLWRWISLRTFSRGRLVPRQPWAIKRTTRTELHHEGICIAKFFHWNNGAIPTALYRYNIHNGEYIHRNTDITPTALHHERIYIAKFIHWDNSAIPTQLRDETTMCMTWLVIKRKMIWGKLACD